MFYVKHRKWKKWKILNLYTLENPIEVSLLQYKEMVGYFITLEVRLELVLGEQWQTIIQETIL